MPATYRNAEIKRCATMVTNMSDSEKQRFIALLDHKPAPTREARAKAAVKQVRDWRERPASQGQINRINGLEKSLGYRRSTRTAIGTAGAASDLYQSLKAERNAL